MLINCLHIIMIIITVIQCSFSPFSPVTVQEDTGECSCSLSGIDNCDIVMLLYNDTIVDNDKSTSHTNGEGSQCSKTVTVPPSFWKQPDYLRLFTCRVTIDGHQFNFRYQSPGEKPGETKPIRLITITNTSALLLLLLLRGQVRMQQRLRRATQQTGMEH